MTFNLVEDPWILVAKESGPDEVSLRQLFAELDVIRGIGGEVPTQGFAILRIVLAICHHAIGWHTDDDLHDLWDRGLDVPAIQAYLDEWKHRFELFDPQRPFMQVPDLRTAKDEHASLRKIIADVPDGHQFFTTRSGPAMDRIAPAEAARWLVHAHAFDTSGIKSGAVGDSLVQGGKGYPIGPGWSGELGGIVLHGRSLADTIRLNIVRTPVRADDVPTWARTDHDTSGRQAEGSAPGPVSLLTWQSRRVRLVREGDHVVGVVLSQGDKLAPQNMQQLEALTGWRYSRPQSKKLGRPVYMPNQHEPARSLWRGLPALLASSGKVVDTLGTFDAHLSPGTLSELPPMQDSFVVQTVGIAYGAQNAVIEEIIDDRQELHGSLLGDEALPVRRMVGDAVGNATDAVRCLGNLAANLARAAGEKGESAGEGDRERVMSLAWGALDQPARRWIGALEATTDVLAAQSEWQRTVASLLRPLAHQLVSQASPAGVRGRETSFGFMSAPLAHLYFDKALAKALPLTQLDANQEAQTS